MSDHGHLDSEGAIVFSRRLSTDRQTVWDHFVEPGKRALWFCGGSNWGTAGDRIELAFDHSHLSRSAPPEKYAEQQEATHHGELTACDEPGRLAFTWFESDGDSASEVEIDLHDASGGSTQIDLRHSGISDREMILGALAGWHAHLDLLGEVIEGGRQTDFWIRDQQLEAEYAGRV